ncbi:hypothetical protein I350_08009 [Cryptococcus amylolentus CBS 6273]|uniref:Uncharacterized protein n=1 Tax=Cryptococcus amylolentus CBS 6273 TaxID=1296118 RepID=A0A1E3JAT8_9TREE|nr:hypothetical protein I350_08009 [Cryptococcus amylolentus CBS 6273]
MPFLSIAFLLLMELPADALPQTVAALQAEIDGTMGQMLDSVQRIHGREHALDHLQGQPGTFSFPSLLWQKIPSLMIVLDLIAELEAAAQHFKTVGKDTFVKQYYCKNCDAPYARSPEAPHDHETCIRCNAVLVDKAHKIDCPFRWVKQKPPHHDAKSSGSQKCVVS